MERIQRRCGCTPLPAAVWVHTPSCGGGDRPRTELSPGPGPGQAGQGALAGLTPQMPGALRGLPVLELHPSGFCDVRHKL
mmetsp:Transcript_149420/g.261011  ORF Transcript_149420/g.261011 Transcript_149420/m.261011 type:complete len:80 (+) Transcript_149420:313-552(+)